MVEALNEFGTHAINTTTEDLRRLNRLAETGRLPKEIRGRYLATMLGTSPPGPFPVKPYAIETLRREPSAEEIRVGILAVSPPDAGSGAVGKLLDADEAIRQFLPEVESRSDLVVLLARMSDAELVRLARMFPAIDVIINGTTVGEGRELPRIGNTVIVESAHQGVALGTLDVEWDAGGQVTKSQNQFIPLMPMIPDSPTMAAIVEKAHQDALMLEEEEARRSPPVATPSIFAGAKECVDCHEKAYKVWQKSRHARAIETLKATANQFNKNCVQCHVTGFGVDRGFVNFLRTPALANVQCEACHGAALDHSKSPQTVHPGIGLVQQLRRKVSKEFCRRCHTQENSPRFNFEQYWPKIAH